MFSEVFCQVPNIIMSIPVLRRPKHLIQTKNHPASSSKNEFMILTLKNGKKLVVSSDSFHSIITTGDKYKCLICNSEMKLEDSSKENHKELEVHKQQLALNPHREEFEENLIRQLDNETCYCTICNVSLLTHSLMRHLSAEGHTSELNKAKIRSLNYKPFQ